MKKFIVALVALISGITAIAQGTLQFNNRIVGTVEARVYQPDFFTGVGAGFSAQLYVGLTPNNLGPVTPTTIFRTTSAAALGYVIPVDVTVPGIPGGTQVFVQMKAWDGKSFETTLNAKGASNIIPVTLGGGGIPPTPAAPLVGLMPFVVGLPEPSTVALASLGVVVLLLRRPDQPQYTRTTPSGHVYPRAAPGAPYTIVPLKMRIADRI